MEGTYLYTFKCILPASGVSMLGSRQGTASLQVPATSGPLRTKKDSNRPLSALCTPTKTAAN